MKMTTGNFYARWDILIKFYIDINIDKIKPTELANAIFLDCGKAEVKISHLVNMAIIHEPLGYFNCFLHTG